MLSVVDIKMLQHGEDRNYKILVPSENLINSALEIFNRKYKISVSKVKDINLAKKQSEEFIKSNFNLHDINFATESNYSHFIRNNKHLSLNLFVDKINNSFRSMDPYSLPIDLVEEKIWFGKIFEATPRNASEEFLKKANPLFFKVLLSKNLTSLTSSIISHEITHSQTNSVKGAIKSYYNEEVLPTFIDLLQKFETGDFYNIEVEEIIRFKEIASLIINLEKHSQEEGLSISPRLLIYTMNIESVLKAYYLFEIYILSNKNVKNHIKDFIQKIFDGKKTLEELLAFYNINYENSEKLFIEKVYKK